VAHVEEKRPLRQTVAGPDLGKKRLVANRPELPPHTCRDHHSAPGIIAGQPQEFPSGEARIGYDAGRLQGACQGPFPQAIAYLLASRRTAEDQRSQIVNRDYSASGIQEMDQVPVRMIDDVVDLPLLATYLDRIEHRPRQKGETTPQGSLEGRSQRRPSHRYDLHLIIPGFREPTQKPIRVRLHAGPTFLGQVTKEMDAYGQRP